MFRIRLVLSVTIALVCALLAPPVGFASQTCLTGSDPAVLDDAPQLAVVRDAVDATCPCASYDGTAANTNKDYVKCAKGVINAAVAAGNLRKQCKGAAKAIFVNANCGMNSALHAQPCIETNIKTGKITCKVRPQTKKDGTPTNACVSTTKKTKESCADDVRCLGAADVDDDFRITAPGDDGRCRPIDCEAQLARDMERCDGPSAACAQYCIEHDQVLASCSDGCAYGVIHCKKLANEAHDACVANPRQGCEAVRAAMADRCIATVTLPPDSNNPEPRTMSAFKRYCQYTHYFDVFCYDSLQLFWETPCVSKADEAFAECRAAD
jgi:hypothetical protein